jgi:hypothetical protein
MPLVVPPALEKLEVIVGGFGQLPDVLLLTLNNLMSANVMNITVGKVVSDRTDAGHQVLDNDSSHPVSLLGAAIAAGELCRVTDVILDFSGSTFLKNPKPIFDGLLRLKDTLSKVEMSFCDCEALTDLTCFDALKECEFLLDLYIDFSGCKNAVVETFTVPEFLNPHMNRLKLVWCQVPMDRFRSTAIAFGWIHNLRKFELDLKDTETFDDVAPLSRALSAMYHLQAIHLDFGATGLEKLDPLAAGIKDLYRDVVSLKISFENCQRIRDVKNLAFAIAKFKHLDAFSLNLCGTHATHLGQDLRKLFRNPGSFMDVCGARDKQECAYVDTHVFPDLVHALRKVHKHYHTVQHQASVDDDRCFKRLSREGMVGAVSY